MEAAENPGSTPGTPEIGSDPQLEPQSTACKSPPAPPRGPAFPQRRGATQDRAFDNADDYYEEKDVKQLTRWGGLVVARG